MALRGADLPSKNLDKIVLYEKYFQERMAQVSAVAAQVIGQADPKKASELVSKCMDYLFPEISASKERTVAEKFKELQEFSAKEIKLEVSDLGLKLKMKEKK